MADSVVVFVIVKGVGKELNVMCQKMSARLAIAMEMENVLPESVSVELVGLESFVIRVSCLSFFKKLYHIVHVRKEFFKYTRILVV